MSSSEAPPGVARARGPEGTARAGRQYHGVGTLQDLADYHRLTPTLSKQALAELVEEGRLLPVTVREWDRPAYLHPAVVPR